MSDNILNDFALFPDYKKDGYDVFKLRKSNFCTLRIGNDWYPAILKSQKGEDTEKRSYFQILDDPALYDGQAGANCGLAWAMQVAKNHQAEQDKKKEGV